MAKSTETGKTCLRCQRHHLKIYSGFCRNCLFAVMDGRMRKSVKEVFQKNMKLLSIGEMAYDCLSKAVDSRLNIRTKDAGFFGADNLLNLDSNTGIGQYILAEKIDFIILPWTADLEAACMLETFFTGRNLYPGKKFVRLFRDIDSKTLKMYCKLRKIKYEEFVMPSSAKFLSAMENKYPGIIYSLAKSRQTAEEIDFKIKK